MNTRFEKYCNNFTEVKEYYKNRSRQLLADNYCFNKEHGFKILYDQNGNQWGVSVAYNKIKNKKIDFNKDYTSLYVYKDYVGQGRYKKWVEENQPECLITMPSCEIESLFIKLFGKNSNRYVVLNSFTETKEYKAAENIFGHKKAGRSKQWYMNHIDEGLFVLNYYNCSELVKSAYCLHPVVQLDNDLKRNVEKLDQCSDSKITIALAMEYRSVANEYLCHRNIDNIKQIRLSPLGEVNDMLRADKIQNYKDFLLYHKDTHPKSRRLEKYFMNWFERLEISSDDFNKIKEIITW